MIPVMITQKNNHDGIHKVLFREAMREVRGLIFQLFTWQFVLLNSTLLDSIA